MSSAAEKRDDDKIELPQWLTTAEAAAYLRISPGALLNHISRGNIKPDHWGGRGRLRSHRFSKATLDRFVRGERAA